MNEKIEIGSLVFCYLRERYVGRCYGLKTVVEIVQENGLDMYRVTRADCDDEWYPANNLVLAQFPPAGTETKFKVGDHVHCFGTYQNHYTTAHIVHILWSDDGKPEYYITPTDTPWCPVLEDAMKLVVEMFVADPDLPVMVF
ncbi:TPA: hypothetical protein ACH0SE_004321 [Providencia rettgeri]